MSSTLRGKRLCIDPGHPSENGSGAEFGKLTEIGIVWRVALRLQAQIKQAGGLVILTKGRERENVTNRRRAEIANEYHADLMLRLHCDSAPGASGIATYYPDRQGTAPDGFRGPSPAVCAASARAAAPFHRALIAALRGDLADRGSLTDRQTGIGAKQGALTGSIRSQVPVLLVELCVLDSAHDRAFVSSADGEKMLSAALFAGIVACVSPT